MEASEIELPLVDFHDLVSEDEYLDNLLSVKIAETNMKIAEYDLNNLSAAASKYERRTAELAYQKAKMNYEKTLKEAKDTYRSTINSLEVMLSNLKVLKERIDLNESILKDYQDRYEKGLISKKELNAQKINLLNARKNYLNSLQNYYNTIITLLIDAGKDVSF